MAGGGVEEWINSLPDYEKYSAEVFKMLKGLYVCNFGHGGADFIAIRNRLAKEHKEKYHNLMVVTPE